MATIRRLRTFPHIALLLLFVAVFDIAPTALAQDRAQETLIRKTIDSQDALGMEFPLVAARIGTE